MAHLRGFASEYWIELSELAWSKPWVDNPFLSMMIRPWIISLVENQKTASMLPDR